MKISNSVKILVLFGIVSLLADAIYESARGANGQFLQILGANALIIGLVSGIGEFAGYMIRLVSGPLVDRTKAYWAFTIAGYGLLLFVPLMAFFGQWQIAALFIVLERIGKGIRSPAKDAIVSTATKKIGTGLGFGIVEFLDQIGAVGGPLLFSFMLASNASLNPVADYQSGYLILGIPFILLMAVLLFAKFASKNGIENKEFKSKKANEPLSATFWTYTIFTAATTLGFAGFALIGYHLKLNSIVSDPQIVLLYALAMAVDAFAALAIGKIYDNLKKSSKNEKAGLNVLIVLPILTALSCALAFTTNIVLIIAGLVFWRIVMGVHETIMKAAVADLTHISKRGTGYGVLNTGYGISAMIGSVIIGLLYDFSIPFVIAFIVATQIAAVAAFVMMKKQAEKG